MPRKIRQLKADPRRAGFVEDPKHGKGSHSWWYHPDVAGAAANLAGDDGDDALHYQEKEVRAAIRQAREAEEQRWKERERRP